MKNMHNKGFTLIELLVVISIISLLSSVVFATLSTTRKKARDSQRIQNARQIALALEQYENTFNTYKVEGSGLSSDPGSGFVAKSGGSYSANSILSTLKSAGLYSNSNLKDPVYGLDNYYLGLCTSTNAYNVFVKLEQEEYNQATSTIANTCGGAEASALGFSFIASTAGGSSGGGGTSASGGSGYGGFYETGMSAPDIPIIGPDGFTYGTVIGADGKTWLDRNLGAARVATALNDSQSYGHLYQWGRRADGHQIPTSLTTNATSSTDTPGHSNFIYNYVSPNDWLISKNDNLWQGVNGINNPCPVGFRIPTMPEWVTLKTTSNITNNITAYNSTLKLPSGGFRSDGGSWVLADSYGYFWSSTVGGSWVSNIQFNSSSVNTTGAFSRASGFSIRCVKN